MSVLANASHVRGTPPTTMRRRILSITAIMLAIIGASLVVGILAMASTVPDLSQLESHTPERTNYMRLLAAEQGLSEETYRVEPMEVLTSAPLLACAVVKSEDVSFFRHGGVDWGQIALILFDRSGKAMGGSTITQQLARNLYLTPERSLERKLREAFVARALEQRLSKRRILDLYLNVIEWGDGTWGVGPAAQRYFHKAPAALDTFEASFLSALIPAPRRPLQGANLARAERLQQRVLYQLYASGIIEEEDWRQAIVRSKATFACLRLSKPLDEALTCTQPPREADAGATPPFLTRLDESPLPRVSLLETGCGVERDLFEARRLEATRRVRRDLPTASP